jgi:hypothetical protein
MTRAGLGRNQHTGAKTKQTKNPSPTTEEGMRLVRAFVRVRDQAVREEILKFAEQLSRLPDKEALEADRLRHGLGAGAWLM